ncbi:MAG: cupin domain-containing protein [Acidobacteriota bacterium]
MKRVVTIALALPFAVLGAALAQEKPAAGKSAPGVAAAPTHTVLNASEISWGDAPPGLPPGSRMAVLQGNPGKPGMFTVRVKAPDGYRVPKHWHPTAEHLTILSGSFNVLMGDGTDMSKATPLTAGAFATMPAKMRHELVCQGETEFQVSAMGPFVITYVNAADDPRKAAH